MKTREEIVKRIKEIKRENEYAYQGSMKYYVNNGVIAVLKWVIEHEEL